DDALPSMPCSPGGVDCGDTNGTTNGLVAGGAVPPPPPCSSLPPHLILSPSHTPTHLPLLSSPLSPCSSPSSPLLSSPLLSSSSSPPLSIPLLSSPPLSSPLLLSPPLLSPPLSSPRPLPLAVSPSPPSLSLSVPLPPSPSLSQSLSQSLSPLFHSFLFLTFYVFFSHAVLSFVSAYQPHLLIHPPSYTHFNWATT